MNVAVVISTYNRTDDAKINMELIRNLWKPTNLFNDIKIIHTYNGLKEWYQERYLEDSLVVVKNKGHFHGAADLLDKGFAEISKQHWSIDYVIFLSADTWLLDPNFLSKIIKEMDEKDLYLATNTWDALPGKPGNVFKAMAVDFFILDYKWALKSKIFPINYGEFKEKFEDLYYYQAQIIMVERILIAHFLRAIHKQTNIDSEIFILANKRIKIIDEREPVHERLDENNQYVRKMYWPEIGLITEHKPENKKIILKNLSINVGPNCKKLVNSEDSSYYNNGFVSFQNVN
ncbi:MAG: hypothetical protein WAX66_02820 [Patescibacteria group bacterium]